MPSASPPVRRLRRSLLPRRFPPTREGWWFLVATLLVGGAAVNGGINLLFLVFGMMLLLIIASGVMSELGLRGLEVSRRPPAAIYARTPFLMGIAVRNTKKKLPTFSLEVEDLVDGRPVDRRCYYLKLPAEKKQETAYRHTLPKRGIWRLNGFRISTRFPFGLIRKSRDLEATAELLIYPELVPVPEAAFAALSRGTGHRSAPKPVRRGDFQGLREFRVGDDPRDIHWKITARRGRPFLRECEEDTSLIVTLVLESGGVGTTADNFEAAVSLTASIAVALLKKGMEVGMVTHDGHLLPSSAPAHRLAILKALALISYRQAGAPLGKIPRTTPVLRIAPGTGSEGPRIEADRGSPDAALLRAAAAT